MGTVLVDIRPEDPAPPWVADALEQNIIREILAYQHIRVADKREVDITSCRDDDCRMRLYGQAGVDFAMIGVAGEGRLRYEIFECWTPARVTSGSFGLGVDTTMTRLKQRILGAAAPFVAKGGLLDEKPFLAQRRLFPTDEDPAETRGATAVLAVLGGLFAAAALFFAIPLLVALLGIARKYRFRKIRLRSRRWIAPTVIATAVLAVHCWTDWLTRLWTWLDPQAHASGVLQILGTQLASWEWLIAVSGGLLWGAFLVAMLRTAFPPIGGMDRIAHQDVMRLLKAWLMVCLQRIVLLSACYTPFALLFWWISGWFPAAQRFALIFVAPLAGLLLRAWFLALVESCSMYLDDRLVAGYATTENPWHRDVHRYFQGYLNRTGWSVDPRLLDSVLFLPGKSDEVVCYGGGSTHPRILIPSKLLLSAIGAPEEVPPESSFVPWSEGLAGTVLRSQTNPSPGQASVTRRAGGALNRVLGALLRPLRARRRRQVQTRSSPRRKMLGQAATSLGYAVPFPPEELVPLIADGTEDFEIVRKLLAEHYAWFEADPDDVSDDTDPTDLDYLFGVLVREIGQIQRQESQLTTLLMALQVRCTASWAWVRAPGRAVVEVYRRLFSRAPAMLADGFTALNLARHHLIQYLYHIGWQQEDLLSARADGPELAAISREIFERVRGTKSGRLDRQRRRATVRNRLVWLSHFFHTGLAAPGRRWVRILVGAVVSLTAIAGSFFLVKQAVDYHPTYAERIAALERKIKESKREKAREDKESTEHGQKG